MKGTNKLVINHESLKAGLKYWLTSQVMYGSKEQLEVVDVEVKEDKSAEITINYKEKEEIK